jgi:hypothetical protein
MISLDGSNGTGPDPLAFLAVMRRTELWAWCRKNLQKDDIPPNLESDMDKPKIVELIRGLNTAGRIKIEAPKAPVDPRDKLIADLAAKVEALGAQVQAQTVANAAPSLGVTDITAPLTPPPPASDGKPLDKPKK